MTSLKRPHNNSQGSYDGSYAGSYDSGYATYDTSFSGSNFYYSSQQSEISTSKSDSQDESFYSGDGWADFPEFLGFDFQNGSLAQDIVTDVERNGIASVVGDSCTGIKSWTSHELAVDRNSINDGPIHAPPDGYPAAKQDVICYGMIYRTRAKLMGQMSNALHLLNSSEVPQTQSGTHFLLHIDFDGEHLVVRINPKINLARLNQHLEESLKELVSNQCIQLQAVVYKRTLFDDIDSATRAKDAYTHFNINVYGSISSASTNGRQLSLQKVWLQRPDWHPPECTYENPHFIKTELTSAEPCDLQEEIDDNRIGGENLEKSVQEVYSMLTRDDHLNGSLGEDSRLKTSLLPHQAKAYDFMHQRENGPIPEQFQLWEIVSRDDQNWYQHKIAGIKSRIPPVETGGGILADEMGMGKTFAMLSLLVNSLDAASAWARDPETKLTDGIIPSRLLSRATLVVVPSPLLLATWTDEIEARLNFKLRVFVHHGRDRPIDPARLVDHDVVLTTYHTLVADHNKHEAPVSGIAWYRIILDEAHTIRRSTTYLHKRVAELDAKYRWCLTGTPIQNSLEDVGALFVFLRIFPFDRLNMFRKCISVPFKEGSSRRTTAQRNLAKLLDALCVRRTKALLNLLEPTETICNVHFSDPERRQYNKTKEDMRRTMHQNVRELESGNRFGMFQAQLQLRLLCNHGTFQHQFHWARARNLLDEREDVLMAVACNTGEGVCSGCRQLIPAIDLDAAGKYQLKCTHFLCQECRLGIGKTCPICDVTTSDQRHNKHIAGTRSLQARATYFEQSGHSSKMEALIYGLLNADPNDKNIIFSHWTTTLDLVGQHLQKQGLRFERIDGSDDLSHRKRVLQKFKTDESLRILVMTTGVGAFGLNLISANCVHLLEPQWNPSVELQAVGRTLRIGQKRAVKVTRYIVESTVEQYMQNLQRRKLRMAGMATKSEKLAVQEDPEIKNEFQADFDGIFG